VVAARGPGSVHMLVRRFVSSGEIMRSMAPCCTCIQSSRVRGSDRFLQCNDRVQSRTAQPNGQGHSEFRFQRTPKIWTGSRSIGFFMPPFHRLGTLTSCGSSIIFFMAFRFESTTTACASFTMMNERVCLVFENYVQSNQRRPAAVHDDDSARKKID